MRRPRVLTPVLALMALAAPFGPLAAQTRATTTGSLSTAQPTTQSPAGMLTVAASPSTVAAAAKGAGKNAIAAAQDVKARFPTTPYGEVAIALVSAGYSGVETLVALHDVMNASIDQQILALATTKMSVADIIRAVHQQNQALTARFVIAPLRQARRDDAEIVKALLEVFGLDANGAATAFSLAGGSSQDVAEALRNGLSLDLDHVAEALRAAGFKEDGIALGLVSSFNAAPDRIAALFHKWQVTPAVAAATLRNTLNQSAQDVVKLMVKVDYAPSEIARGLRDGNKLTNAAIASAFKAAAFVASAAATGLMDGLGIDDQGAFDAMVQSGYPAPDAVQAVAQKAHTTLERAAGMLKVKGIDALTTGATLKDRFGATGDQAAAAMKSAKYTVREITQVMLTTFAKSALDTGAILKKAQFDPVSIRDALMEVFKLDLAAVVQLLAQIGLTVSSQ